MKKNILNFRNVLFSLMIICFATLNAQINFQWAKQMGGNNMDRGYAIATDASGNVYTTGFFRGLADFDPGVGTYTLTTSGINDFDIFVSKLDASGNFVWAKQIVGLGVDYGMGISVDGIGNVNITGYFEGNNVDFDPGPGIYSLSSNNASNDIFILKLDAAGNFMWAKSIGSVNDDKGLAITTNSLGEVFTTGYFESTADFDPSASTYTMNAGGGLSAFISKLDNNVILCVG